MSKERNLWPSCSLLEDCSYSLCIHSHLILSSISPSGWAAIGNHLKSGWISAASQIQASTSDEPPETRSLVGRWVFLSSVEACRHDHPHFLPNANMWISVCWPRRLPWGSLLLLTCYRHICKYTSDICRHLITKTHKLSSFNLTVSIPLSFRHSL